MIPPEERMMDTLFPEPRFCESTRSKSAGCPSKRRLPFRFLRSSLTGRPAIVRSLQSARGAFARYPGCTDTKT